MGTESTPFGFNAKNASIASPSTRIKLPATQPFFPERTLRENIAHGERGAKAVANDGEASSLARNSQAAWLMEIPARGCQIGRGKALFWAQDRLKTG
jgi:hypothetical protein